MSRLARDGTAEAVSRERFLRHERGKGKIISPVQMITSRLGSHIRLIHALLHIFDLLHML